MVPAAATDASVKVAARLRSVAQVVAATTCAAAKEAPASAAASAAVACIRRKRRAHGVSFSFEQSPIAVARTCASSRRIATAAVVAVCTGCGVSSTCAVVVVVVRATSTSTTRARSSASPCCCALWLCAAAGGLRGRRAVRGRRSALAGALRESCWNVFLRAAVELNDARLGRGARWRSGRNCRSLLLLLWLALRGGVVVRHCGVRAQASLLLSRLLLLLAPPEWKKGCCVV